MLVSLASLVTVTRLDLFHWIRCEVVHKSLVIWPSVCPLDQDVVIAVLMAACPW